MSQLLFLASASAASCVGEAALMRVSLFFLLYFLTLALPIQRGVFAEGVANSVLLAALAGALFLLPSAHIHTYSLLVAQVEPFYYLFEGAYLMYASSKVSKFLVARIHDEDDDWRSSGWKAVILLYATIGFFAAILLMLSVFSEGEFKYKTVVTVIAVIFMVVATLMSLLVDSGIISDAGALSFIVASSLYSAHFGRTHLYWVTSFLVIASLGFSSSPVSPPGPHHTNSSQSLLHLPSLYSCCAVIVLTHLLTLVLPIENFVAEMLKRDLLEKLWFLRPHLHQPDVVIVWKLGEAVGAFVFYMLMLMIEFYSDNDFDEHEHGD